jgi:hypothetical protein
MTKKKSVTVSDRMQMRYTYVISAPVGKKFDLEFKPELTPKQMLALGVFGGKYMTDCTKEFPKHWFVGATLAEGHADKNLNYFGVCASQSLSEWRRKGWIYKDDPRGWFQWYCRYYRGRRIPKEDARQIKRWKMMRRHLWQIVHNCARGDMLCRLRQRQALLHWAYDTRNV